MSNPPKKLGGLFLLFFLVEMSKRIKKVDVDKIFKDYVGNKDLMNNLIDDYAASVTTIPNPLPYRNERNSNS
jgi:hypothetical protein